MKRLYILGLFLLLSFCGFTQSSRFPQPKSKFPAPKSKFTTPRSYFTVPKSKFTPPRSKFVQPRSRVSSIPKKREESFV